MTWLLDSLITLGHLVTIVVLIIGVPSLLAAVINAWLRPARHHDLGVMDDEWLADIRQQRDSEGEAREGWL